jgi:hypothetical protein
MSVSGARLVPFAGHVTTHPMKEYKTSDIQLAALLCSEGVVFVRVENGEDRERRFFVFEDELRIADLVSGFWRDEIFVTPRKYMGAYKEMKNMLHAG